MGTLHHVEIGDGPTWLMMHGGLGLDHAYLRGHDALADRARLAYYDHRGHGRSTRDGLAGATHATWHADADALLDELGAARAVIYGHSYGAWLALGFALRYPARVRGLVLCAASPAFDYPADVMARVAAAPPAVAARFAELLAAPPATDADLADGWRAILPLYFHGPVPPDALAGTRYSAAGYAAGAAALAGFDLVPELGALRCPTLILAGAHDFITPPAQAHRIAAAAPAGVVEVAEFAASGHFPFLEEPAAYFAALRAWASRLGDAVGSPA